MGAQHPYEVNSPRAGGLYQIYPRYEDLALLENTHKARLTTWLVEQRRLGNNQPLITESIVKETEAASNMRASERADRVLQFLAERTQILGTPVLIVFLREGKLLPGMETCLELLAHSESIGRKDLAFLFDDLVEKKLMKISASAKKDEYELTLTVDGYDRARESGEEQVQS